MAASPSTVQSSKPQSMAKLHAHDVLGPADVAFVQVLLFRYAFLPFVNEHRKEFKKGQRRLYSREPSEALLIRPIYMVHSSFVSNYFPLSLCTFRRPPCASSNVCTPSMRACADQPIELRAWPL